MAALVSSGALAASVEKTYGLADVPAAFRRSAAGGVLGKLAISIDSISIVAPASLAPAAW